MSLARISGLVYVLTFVFGTLALLVPSSRAFSNPIAALSYIAVTILFYFLFRPVSRGLSLAAALISLTGCVVSVLVPMRVIDLSINPLPLFGVYCLLIGYLVYHSTYLPKFIGVLMAFGGLGWLTFAMPSLSAALSPYNFAPGIVAEGILTLWLVIAGVDRQRWDAMTKGVR